MNKVKKDGLDTGLLEKMRQRRGDLLSYHEMFYLLDPDLLDKYNKFYMSLALKKRVLDDKTKELVWIGILTSVGEEAGIIHIRRGREAGITDEELSEVFELCQVAKGFEILLFLKEKWAKHLPKIRVFQIYEHLIDRLRQGSHLSDKAIELIFIGIYAALGVKEGLRFHFRRTGRFGLRDREIAEAISFVFLPRGGNAVLDAVDVLKDFTKKGRFKPESVFRYWSSVRK